MEHFIKTLKSKLYRYIVEKNPARYIDILQKMVNSYNRTWHSGIQSEPINFTKGMKNNYGGKCIGLKNFS